MTVTLRCDKVLLHIYVYIYAVLSFHIRSHPQPIECVPSNILTTAIYSPTSAPNQQHKLMGLGG